MDTEPEAPGRDLGVQPLAALMEKHGLKATDLVGASTEQLTHKMVARACKGRRLTPHVQKKVLAALNARTGESYALAQLFTYGV